DQRMPRMTGTELLEKVRQRSKDTVRVILSGYADLEVMMDSINRGNVYMYIKKPWNDDRLRAQIRQCLVHYETTKQNETLVEHLHFQQSEIEKSHSWMAEKHGKLGPYIQLLVQGLQVIPLPVLFLDHQCKVVFINNAAKDLFPSLDDVTDPVKMEEVLIQDLTSGIDQFLESPDKEAEISGFNGIVKIQRVEYEGFSAGCVLSFFLEDQPS
ncbi:response regulator, partial [bacterium]|nr:response regulator [bacterium]